jgi:hypothetical protein
MCDAIGEPGDAETCRRRGGKRCGAVGLEPSADETHDALMELYRSRYGEQVEIAEMDEVLEGWR